MDIEQEINNGNIDEIESRMDGIFKVKRLPKIGNNLKVVLSLATQEEKMEWSSGEVTSIETLHYRTGKPAIGGLFCPQLFGPINNYECICGRYQGKRYDGIICEKCAVEVTTSAVRRERMAHIVLPVKMAHPWFYRANKNRIALLLNKSSKNIRRIVNLEQYIVIEKGDTPFQDEEIISKQDYDKYALNDGFISETGAEAIYKLLSKIDFNDKILELETQLATINSEIQRKKIKETINLCLSMREGNTRPEDTIFSTIMVLPPELRPLVELDAGQFVSSEINESYRVLIYRSKRLESLIKNKVNLSIIFENEIRLLQQAVDRLFGAGGDEVQKKGTKVLTSIEKRLKGKEGFLRKAILGKRVDYSGRSVITGAPHLLLDECYLPTKMALELFKPIISGCLKLNGIVFSNKQARKLIDNQRREAVEILNEIIKSTFPVVILNRAPTLHRIGMMAFKIKLWNKKSIGVNPLVCPAFNADFDGDQMGVHVVLSEESKAEAWTLMRPSKNLASVAHGNLNVGAFKDICLGLYVLTVGGDKQTNIVCNSISELENALFHKRLTIWDLVTVRMTETGSEFITAPAGRFLLWKIIPIHSEIKFDIVNKPVNNKVAQLIMEKVRKHCGDLVLTNFVDKVKDIGMKYAELYGASISKDDLLAIPGADDLINKAIESQKKMSELVNEGISTHKELKTKSIKKWAEVNAQGKVILEKEIEKYPHNPVVIIMKSGARGSIAQLLQTLFMKGNVVDSNGEISIIPIWTNHKIGIDMFGYYAMSQGSRKTVVDVAIKTGKAGHLTRIMNDIVHPCIVTSHDCKTENYITARNTFKNGSLQSTVYELIIGRILAKDITMKGKVLFTKDTLINDDVIDKLKELDIVEVPIRSPISCKNLVGICRLCYGSDLSSKELVALGEPVGVQAAQSVGEPGTQLTMRSFHAGGVAKFGVMKSQIISPFEGVIKFHNLETILDLKGNTINISRDAHIYILNKQKMILADYEIQYGATILVKNKENVSEDTVLANWSKDRPLLAETDSVVEFRNFILNANYELFYDETTNRQKKNILKYKIAPLLILKSENGNEVTYYLSEDTVLEVEAGQKVKAGTTLALMRDKIESIDIVGSLTQVINILENRMPKNPAILSRHKGIVSISKNSKGKSVITIKEENSDKFVEVVVDGTVIVQNDQKIKEGDQLTLGKPVLQDILDIFGVNKALELFISELQDIYIKNGIKINNKHLEIIFFQMCRKYEILHSSIHSVVPGSIIDYRDLSEINIKLKESHRTLMQSRRLILGITDGSLNSPSPLSSASFQNTIRVLIDQSLKRAEDRLEGMKENIIVGTLIKAGTGLILIKLLELAHQYNHEKIKRYQALKARMLMIKSSTESPLMMKSSTPESILTMRESLDLEDVASAFAERAA